MLWPGKWSLSDFCKILDTLAIFVLKNDSTLF